MPRVGTGRGEADFWAATSRGTHESALQQTSTLMQSVTVRRRRLASAPITGRLLIGADAAIITWHFADF